MHEHAPHATDGHVEEHALTLVPVVAASADLLPDLAEQGGPMRPEERTVFEAEPFASQALSLRRWDEEANQPGARVAALESYRAALLRHLTPGR